MVTNEGYLEYSLSTAAIIDSPLHCNDYYSLL